MKLNLRRLRDIMILTVSILYVCFFKEFINKLAIFKKITETDSTLVAQGP